MSVDSDWDTKSSGQSEISNFNTSIFINQQVLRLHISVEDPSLVTEEYPLTQLVQVGLSQLGIHLTILGDVGVHVLLEVHGEELKDEVELCLLHQHILPW